MILKGQVNVIVENNIDLGERSPRLNANKFIRRIIQHIVPNFNDNSFTQNVVSILNSGDTFGELSLILERPRAATIQCITNVKVAYLNKNDFIAILGDLE